MAAELELRALGNIISTSIDRILDRCSKESLSFPSIHEPANNATEEVRNDPEVAISINLLVAAATQLIATVRPPAKTLFVNAYSVCLMVSRDLQNLTNDVVDYEFLLGSRRSRKRFRNSA